MAFDFVQLDTSLTGSIPVRIAANALGLEPWMVLGLLYQLQVWAVARIPSGRFEPSPASAGRPDAVREEEAAWSQALEDAVHWKGEAGAVWDAFLRAGLLVREGNTIRLATSDRYVQVLEKRAKEAERKRQARAKARGGASAGRPADVRPQKRREETRRDEFSAAAGESPGASAGRPVLAPPPEDVSADALPVQRALPGAALVPASPPREERLQAAAMASGATDAGPEALPAPAAPGPAVAFFRRCLEARRKAHPHLPAVAMPAGWVKWYADALTDPAVQGDEGRLFLGWLEYLRDTYAAENYKPPYPADAFTSAKVWPRHVGMALAGAAAEASAAPELPTVDVSTEAGRSWKRIVDVLTAAGKDYALTWLLKASPVALVNGDLVLQCPDAHFRNWVMGHYGEMVANAASDCEIWGVRWVVAEHGQAATASS